MIWVERAAAVAVAVVAGEATTQRVMRASQEEIIIHPPEAGRGELLLRPQGLLEPQAAVVAVAVLNRITPQAPMVGTAALEQNGAAREAAAAVVWRAAALLLARQAVRAGCMAAAVAAAKAVRVVTAAPEGLALRASSF